MDAQEAFASFFFLFLLLKKKKSWSLETTTEHFKSTKFLQKLVVWPGEGRGALVVLRKARGESEQVRVGFRGSGDLHVPGIRRPEAGHSRDGGVIFYRLASPSLLTLLSPATLDPSVLRFFLLLAAESSEFKPASNANAIRGTPSWGFRGTKKEGGSHDDGATASENKPTSKLALA